jgi:hypothetical protein
MGRTRTTGNLVSENILSVDIINDRVGVGSTQPGYTLDVLGDINFTGTFYEDGAAFVASRWTAGSGTDIYRLSNVGIGTTNPTDAANAGNISILNVGIVTANYYYGDGSNLSGITAGATLSAASGSQRVVLTSLTSGTMTASSTDADLTFDADSNTLSVPNFSSSGVVTATTVDSSTFRNYAETVVDLGTLSGTEASNNIGLSTGNVFYGTLPISGITTFTFTTGLTSGAVSFTLYLKNGASGTPTLSWPVSVVFSGGTAPDRTTIANKTDIWTFSTFDNGTTWYGDIAMYNL